MFRTLRSRLLLTYILIIGVVLFLVGLILFFFLLRNPILDRQVMRDLNLIAAVVASRDERVPARALREQIVPALQSLGLPQTRVIFLNPRGEILSDTLGNLPPPEPDMLAQIGSAQAPDQGRLFDVENNPWLFVSRSLDQGQRLLVMSPRPRLQIFSIFGDDLLLPLLQAGLAALVLSIILAWLISRWVARPLQDMSHSAEAVSAGNYDSPPVPSGPQEVRSLALSFNNMVDKVQASQNAQRDFVANVSHELRTPLTSIQGFAQAILDGAASEPQDQQHAARVIYEESNRLRRMVEDLLDLARLDAGQLQFQRVSVDLVALLKAVSERQQLLAQEKSVHIHVQLQGLPQIVGDGDRLAQVFTNLLANAVSHTPEHGEVVLNGESSGGWVEIHVDDSGPGISQEEMSRIFERFYRADKARTGSEASGAGLGLAISQEIVQAHSGRITVQSIPGRGSRFSVVLPVANPDDTTMARKRE